MNTEKKIPLIEIKHQWKQRQDFYMDFDRWDQEAFCAKHFDRLLDIAMNAQEWAYAPAGIAMYRLIEAIRED